MNEQPGQPGRVAGEADPADLGDGRRAPQRGHGAAIGVPEGGRRSACCEIDDGPGGVLAHLHGGRGHSGDGCSILLDVGEVADHEDVRVTREREVGPHEHTPHAVDRPPECGSQR